MNFIAHLFWNASERRLRALWRLIIYLPIVAVSLVITTLPLPALTPLTDAFDDDIGVVFLSAAAIVIGTLFTARFIDRRPVSDLGLQFTGGWWRDLGFGLFLGAFLMLLIFIVELALGWITVEATLFTTLPIPFGVAVIGPLFVFFLVGIYEELLSRGYQLKKMAEGLSFRPLGPVGGMLRAVGILPAAG